MARRIHAESSEQREYVIILIDEGGKRKWENFYRLKVSASRFNMPGLKSHRNRYSHLTRPLQTLVIVGTAQGLLITLATAPFHSSVSGKPATVWQWAGVSNNTRAAKLKRLNEIQLSFISSFTPVPSPTRQDVFCVKGPVAVAKRFYQVWPMRAQTTGDAPLSWEETGVLPPALKMSPRGEKKTALQ